MAFVILILSMASFPFRRVVVDQAAPQQQLPLLAVGVLQIQGDAFLLPAVEQHRRERVVPLRHPLPHAGDVDKVAVRSLEAVLRCQREGQQPPVHAVGAVTLCRKFIADIRASSQYPLAAGGLLSGGAVTGLVGKNHGADVEIVPHGVLVQPQHAERLLYNLNINLLYRYVFKVTHLGQGQLSRRPQGLQRGGGFGAGHVPRRDRVNSASFMGLER